MGLFDFIHRRQGADESRCPRCGIPVPAASQTCSACGWDVREAYHGAVTGSALREPDPRADGEVAGSGPDAA